ncbi:hypothetical protein V492_00521 [Pseudogymnoascus sp. VKM F-4246]|nr:hypothetical protein V492_00521 [Pseudogymnoascus sp. VKM F-4246]
MASLTALLVFLPTLITTVHAAGAGGPEGVTPLNQGWLFGGEYTPGSEVPTFDDTSFQEVTIPHVVTPLGWNNFESDSWSKIWIYRRHFDLPKHSGGNSVRTFLDFDGVLTITSPSINGHALPTHEGGYLPFTYEITDYVKPTGNVLGVIVDARWSYINPQGSPDGPSSIDFMEPGGINRDVALRTVPSSFISDVFAKPVNVLKSSREVVVEYTIDSAKAPGRVNILSQLKDGNKILSKVTQTNTISESGNQTFALNISTPHVELWSPDSPKLYQVVTTLTVNGKESHRFTRNIGFREAVFTVDGFFLNGSRLKVFGLNRHQSFPYIGMSAPKRLQRRDAEMLKELNNNMVRATHYPQSPYFLDRCDELGIMVWQEVPGWQFVGNETWREHVLSDIREMIIRDRSRPSIIIWGVQINESPRAPVFYTKTKELARSLDGSRQSSGTSVSPQSLVDSVSEVFSYDDYSPGVDGNAYLQPPLTTVPYFVAECVGALVGPKFFRWIDNQHSQQVQSKLHAQVHDIAAGNNSYSGLLGWVGIDYDSLSGNVYKNVKRSGIIDSFRVYKPGASFYLTQGDPSTKARIEPAFYWDFGPVSPVTTLGQNATIWSNADTLEAYINEAHFATLHPDTVNFPHTAHPPFYLDTTKIDASKLPELRLDGYVSKKKATSRTFSGSTRGDGIKITLNDKELDADGIDTTLITFRAVDKYGNPRPYATGDVEVSVTGPGEWISQLVSLDVTANPSVVLAGQTSTLTVTLKNGAFSWTENGGVGGAAIRTLAGRPGTITVKVVHATLGQDSVKIKAIPSPGSLVARAGSPNLSNVELSLGPAVGWTVGSAESVSLNSVQAASTVHASWTVSPQAAGVFYQPPVVTASFKIHNQAAQKPFTVPVYAPLTIEQARNNIGVSNDSNVAVGNFDGLKNTYSTQALAAVGLERGAEFNAGGVTFKWPNVPVGTRDNMLSLGQTILVNGTGKTLGFVGASTNSYNGGVGTIFYTDGSSSRFTLEFGNYFNTQFLVNSVVVTTPYVNGATGQNHLKTGTLFYAGTPLAVGKTVLAVTLPLTNTIASVNPTAGLHIFSISIV